MDTEVASYSSYGSKSGEKRVLLRVEIEDSGIGLSHEAKAKLFAPFQQAQRRAGGTGLGLFSLAKRIEALGGEYGVVDRRDGQCGCCFFFAFPYQPDEVVANSIVEDILPVQSIANPQLKSAMESSKLFYSRDEDRNDDDSTALEPEVGSFDQNEDDPIRILVVEGTLSILKLMTKMLERSGYFVSQAENGFEVLKKLQQQRFDIVILDLQVGQGCKLILPINCRCQWTVLKSSSDCESLKSNAIVFISMIQSEVEATVYQCLIVVSFSTQRNFL